jgi:predicted dehydrogenase
MKSAAIIGCGKPRTQISDAKVGWAIAYAHGNGYQKAFPGVRLLAVDPVAENLHAFGDKFGVAPEDRFASTEALYQRHTPDAVSICTWPALHVPQAIEACRAGVKAVTVEKPIALDIQQIRDLEAAARDKGTRVAVAHQRRYESAFVKARELVASGVLGEKLVFEARVGDDWDILSWSCHWFDMAGYVFDAKPVSVLAGIDHTGQRRYGHAVENASVVLLDYSPTRQALFVTGPATLPQFGVSIRGDKGMLVVAESIRLWTTDGYREIPIEAKPFHDAYSQLFADLWSTVGNDRVSRNDLSLSGLGTHIAYAVHESARTQRRISIPCTTLFAPLEVLQHAPTRATEPKKIALLADPHHTTPDLPDAHDALAAALTSLGHTVTRLDAREDLAPNALRDQDVLVIYHTQRKTRDSHRAVVEPWFKAGKPVVISHCGIGAYADWPEFRAWIGRYWVWQNEPLPPSKHPHVPCEVKRTDARFNTGWDHAWLPTDEMYQQLGEASETIPLATATAADGGTQVYAYQVKTHPNVVAWLPGHRHDAFGLDVVRDGLRASIELACAKSSAQRL